MAMEAFAVQVSHAWTRPKGWLWVTGFESMFWTPLGFEIKGFLGDSWCFLGSKFLLILRDFS